MPTPEHSVGASPKLNMFLWMAQFLAAAVFISAGYMKFTAPIADLAKMIPWTGQLPEKFVRFIGLVDLAGGLGLLLPALTRIHPRLTVLAALGCLLLQILATIFHISRGEVMVTPLNFVLLSLSLFVLWGRGTRVPIVPRG